MKTLETMESPSASAGASREPLWTFQDVANFRPGAVGDLHTQRPQPARPLEAAGHDGARCAEAEELAAAYFTVAEVARRLRVSTATVQSLCRRGALKHYRVSQRDSSPRASTG
jgi:excisionase family DNA binding protein